jgi:hypothetical protein
MPQVLADVGATLILTDLFRSGQDTLLRLFTNNLTPLDSHTLASFTTAAGGGYADQTLTGGSWTIADDGTGIIQATYSVRTFTFTGALTGNATVYGYCLSRGGVLLSAELLSSSATPALSGDFITIAPVFKLSKGTPA